MTEHQLSKESKERAVMAFLMDDLQHHTCSCGAAAWQDAGSWVCARGHEFWVVG